MSTHRKVFCVLLGLQLAVSGCCGQHFSGHRPDISEQIAADPNMRENYNPTLTPITDVAAECYCHVEDAALINEFVGLSPTLHKSRSCRRHSHSVLPPRSQPAFVRNQE